MIDQQGHTTSGHVTELQAKVFQWLKPYVISSILARPGVLSFTARNSKLNYKLTKIKQHGQLVFHKSDNKVVQV
jgi:hypothetical protein